MVSNPTHPEIQLVTFFLNGGEYAIDVRSVREIIGMTSITKTANAPHYLEGMIDLRGAIVPVISLRKRLGMPGPPDAESCCIAVMDFGGVLTGFVIDEVSDVMRVKRADLQPAFDAAQQQWIEGVLNLAERMVVVVDLKHLVEE